MMARFQILSVDEPTGNYVPIRPLKPEMVHAARRQVMSCVPAVDVPDVLAMLGLVEA